MEKITEFRNTLAVPIHKLSIDSLVQEVCLCPEYFEDIYRLTYDEKQDDWELNEDDYESIIPEELRWRN